MNSIKKFFRVLSEGKILCSLTARNIKIKYKDTWFGFVWVLLQPLCTIAILSFVFSQVIRLDIKNFPLFLCVGILPWTYFSSALTEATSSLIANGNLVLKVQFPREVLPLSYCLSNLFDFLFSLTVLLLILYVCRIPLSFFSLCMLLPLILCQLLFVFGLSMILSVLNVFYKDIGHLLSIALMFWFYLTPIFYSLDQIPEVYQTWYSMNPMAYFIEAYRMVLLHGVMPPFSFFGVLFGISFSSLCMGMLFFFIKEKSVAKEL
jgi:ABC-2 type transport system permease protein